MNTVLFIVGTLLVPAQQSSSPDSNEQEVVEAIRDYRDLARKGWWLEVNPEWRSMERFLETFGPNAIHEAVELYRREDDVTAISVLDDLCQALVGMFLRETKGEFPDAPIRNHIAPDKLAEFDRINQGFDAYSKHPCDSHKEVTEDKVEQYEHVIKLLLGDMPESVKYPDGCDDACDQWYWIHTLLRRKKFLLWWSVREAFLERRETVQEIRDIIAAGDVDGDELKNWDVRGKLVQLRVRYGIYLAPFLIELIRLDNDPVAFRQLIGRMWRYTGEKDWPEKPYYINYPDRRDKAEVLRKWWGDQGHKLNRLPELYGAIDKQLKELYSYIENKSAKGKNAGHP